jgi:hypothetical protein
MIIREPTLGSFTRRDEGGEGRECRLMSTRPTDKEGTMKTERRSMLRRWIAGLAFAGVVVVLTGTAGFTGQSERSNVPAGVPHQQVGQTNAGGRASVEQYQRAMDLGAIAADKEQFVASLAARWVSQLSDGGDELTRSLMSLAPDRLLAANRAQSPDELDTAVFGKEPKILGDINSDLVFFKVTPCRIVDTRFGGGGFMVGNTSRSFDTNPGNFAGQGGSPTNCGVPGFDVAAMVLTITAADPSGSGDLQAYPKDAAVPNASVLNFVAGQNIANTTIVALKQSTLDSLEFTVLVDGAGTHLVIDVAGYFYAPTLPTAGRAFAHVIRAAPVPTLDAALTKGFTAVTQPGIGVYCLTAPGISPTIAPAIVSVEWAYSSGNLLAAFQDLMSNGCAGGQFAVRTYDFSGNLTNNVSFNIFIP